MTDEWEMFLRRLTLERHTGMPRWNLTPAPERTQHWMSDAEDLVATRRQELEAIANAEKAERRHLRRVA
jgi:hypothetical protein